MSDQPNPYESPAASGEPLPVQTPLATEFPAQMQRVKTGLSLVYYGICGVLLLALSMPIFFLVGGAANVGGIAAITMGMTGLAVVLAILMVVGQVMCTFIPQESGAKGLALAAVVLQIIYWLVTVGSVADIPRSIAVAIGVAGTLASVGSLICFVLFLRKTSLYIGRDDVAGRAVRTLVVGLVSLVLLLPATVLGQTIQPAGGASPMPAATVLSAVGGLCMLAALLMYANTITYLRKAIKL